MVNSEFFRIFVAELILNNKNMKLVKESIGFFEPIHLAHNGKSGNRIISIVKIQISVRSKKPTILYYTIQEKKNLSIKIFLTNLNGLLMKLLKKINGCYKLKTNCKKKRGRLLVFLFFIMKLL